MDQPTSNSNHKIYYLDDIKIGQRFTSNSLVVDEHQIVAFAQQFDPQPFHTNANLAADTIFGGLVASGWHTAALTMRLTLDTLTIGNGIVGLGAEIAWPNPIRPSDSIRIEIEIIDVKPSDAHKDRGIVSIRTETKNQNNEIVQRLTASILVFRRNKSLNED